MSRRRSKRRSRPRTVSVTRRPNRALRAASNFVLLSMAVAAHLAIILGLFVPLPVSLDRIYAFVHPDIGYYGAYDNGCSATDACPNS